MTPERHHFYLAHVVIETTTPLSITTGITDASFDTLLIRDANGLPTIPGSSLAGVLRHLYAAQHDPSPNDEKGHNASERLFGYADKEQGEASRIHLSWAAIHDNSNRPIEGRIKNSEIQNDALLRLAASEQPTFRDHVKINHRGSAANGAKFDRTALPAGYRFTFEISLWSDTDSDPRWDQLLELLTHPLFRLGGGTRRGYGGIKLAELHHTYCDLKKDYDAYCALPRSLADNNNLTKTTPRTATNTTKQITVTLRADDFWCFGGGHESMKEGTVKPANMLPVMEPKVTWSGTPTRGHLTMRHLYVPASSIKGAIAHRLAYHHNCLTGEFADKHDEPTGYEHTNNKAVKALLGYVKDDSTDPQGQVGRLIIDDIYFTHSPANMTQLMHNSIDRFSGGVRHGALFSEELLYQGEIKFTLTITQPKRIDQETRTALAHTLEDLSNGQLPLGAATTKGHGYFTGDIDWGNNEQWFKNTTATGEPA